MRQRFAPALESRRAWLWAALALATGLLVLGEIAISRVKRTGWTDYTKNSSLRGHVQDLAVGPEGEVWVASDAGLFRLAVPPDPDRQDTGATSTDTDPSASTGAGRPRDGADWTAYMPPGGDVRAILQRPGPGGQAQAQAWFDRTLETEEGQQALGALRIAAEGYTVYLDRQVYEVDYLVTVSKVGPLADLHAAGYDMVLLGSGMYGRFYDNADVFRDEVGIYASFFESDLERLAFEQPHDSLGFGGGKVIVFFLSEKAIQFKQRFWEPLS